MPFKQRRKDSNNGEIQLSAYKNIYDRNDDITASIEIPVDGSDNPGFDISPETSDHDDKESDENKSTANQVKDNDENENEVPQTEIVRKVSSNDGKPDVVRCARHAQPVSESSGSSSSGEFEPVPRLHNSCNAKDTTTTPDTVECNSGHDISIVPMTEIPPDTDTIESGSDSEGWRMSLEHFTSKRQGSKRKKKHVSRRASSFYKGQDTLIDAFTEIRFELDDAMEAANAVDKIRKKASLFAKLTFLCNIVLLVIKVVAVVMSGSISLISSLVDSAVDLVSGLVIWFTTRAVKKRDPYVYPQGRTKLEPLAIVVLSVIMAVASLQLVKEAITKIINLANGSQLPPRMDYITTGISSVTVIVKLVLFLVCRRVPHPTIQALAQDHRNDVLSNTVAIIFGYIGSTDMQKQVQIAELVYVDPLGAILICLYIAVTWCMTGLAQTKMLTGHTAPADFLSKLTWICVDHHPKIRQVETVRAFHFGNNFLVEVDIVLPETMTVKESHNIGECLQQKLERLAGVERAFVHVDYEATHKPSDEHKVV